MKTKISLHEFSVNCFIGCLNKERIEKQTIEVNLSLVMNGMPPLPDDKISDTWDYTELAKQIGFILEEGRFHLLETAARFTARYLLLPNLHEKFTIDALELSLTKFDVVSPHTNAAVSLEANAGDFKYAREIKSWGWVDVVDENSRLGLYRLNIHSAQQIENHYHNVTREAELVLNSGIEITKDSGSYKKVLMGEVFHWQNQQCHGYKNMNASTASILCIDEPPFKQSDEILKKVTV